MLIFFLFFVFGVGVMVKVLVFFFCCIFIVIGIDGDCCIMLINWVVVLGKLGRVLFWRESIIFFGFILVIWVVEVLFIWGIIKLG